MTGEARYRVRAFDRALHVLRVLNQYNGLNASEMSRLAGLPRPTVLRILMTLADEGYVVRSEADGCFRVTLKVRELSRGYQEESWLGRIVLPLLHDLEEELLWPLAVVRLHGASLFVEALTDHRSHMVWRRWSPGEEVSARRSASAHLYMALGSAAERERLLARAFAPDRLAEPDDVPDAAVLSSVAAVTECGFALVTLATHSSISVPVWVGGALHCALNIRLYGAPAVTGPVIPQYVAELATAADALADAISAELGMAQLVHEAPKAAARIHSPA